MAKSTKTNAEKLIIETARDYDSELYRYLKELYRHNGCASSIYNREVKELEGIISKDPQIQGKLRAYQGLSHVLNPNVKKTLAESIARLIYSRLGKKQANYTQDEIIKVYLPKLNLGPLKMIPGSVSKKDASLGGIDGQWLLALDNDEEAAEVLSRVKEQEIRNGNANLTPTKMKQDLDDRIKNGK